MPDVFESGVIEEEADDASAEELTEETGALSPEGPGKVSVHLQYDGQQRKAPISELSLRVIHSVLRTVSSPNSTAALQLGIAMGEVEKALEALGVKEGSSAAPLSRAERRRMLKQ